MTQQEFNSEYKKLESAYPNLFNNSYRKNAVAEYIMDMDQRWWVSIVNRILVSGNTKIDIEDAARGERLAKKRIAETSAMLATQEELHSKISDHGLEDVLSRLGAKSLVEAIGGSNE